VALKLLRVVLDDVHDFLQVLLLRMQVTVKAVVHSLLLLRRFCFDGLNLLKIFQLFEPLFKAFHNCGGSWVLLSVFEDPHEIV
jgi:hypothetical protein